MEQPYAESFVYNAIRKTVDFGQLEFLKSGNRQPVPVTTRFYSRWQKKFLFTETDDKERLRFCSARSTGFPEFWATASPSGSPIRGRPIPEHDGTGSPPHGRHEAGEGLMTLDGEYAAATPRSWPVPPSTKHPRRRPQLHQAAIQRVHALRPRKHVTRSRPMQQSVIHRVLRPC